MELFKFIEDKLVRVDSMIAQAKDDAIEKFQKSANDIENRLVLDSHIETINRLRQDKLDHLSEFTTSQMFEKSKEQRVYLKYRNAITPELVSGLFAGLLAYNHELSLFKKLQYFNLSENLVQEINMTGRQVRFDSLLCQNPINLPSIDVYYLSANRYVLRGDEELILTDSKLNAIKVVNFGSNCAVKEIGIVSSDRILLTVLDSNQYVIYSFDYDLNVIKSRILSQREIYVQFSSNSVFFKLDNDSLYSILDGNLNKVATQTDSKLDSDFYIHTMTQQRAIYQRIKSPEITIIQNDQPEIRFTLDDKSHCRNAFFDSELNSYFKLKDENDIYWLECYDSTGEFRFKKFLDIFQQHDGFFDVHNDRLYFYRNIKIKKLV